MTGTISGEPNAPRSSSLPTPSTRPRTSSRRPARATAPPANATGSTPSADRPHRRQALDPKVADGRMQRFQIAKRRSCRWPHTDLAISRMPARLLEPPRGEGRRHEHPHGRARRRDRRRLRRRRVSRLARASAALCARGRVRARGRIRPAWLRADASQARPWHRRPREVSATRSLADVSRARPSPRRPRQGSATLEAAIPRRPPIRRDHRSSAERRSRGRMLGGDGCSAGTDARRDGCSAGRMLGGTDARQRWLNCNRGTSTRSASTLGRRNRLAAEACSPPRSRSASPSCHVTDTRPSPRARTRGRCRRRRRCRRCRSRTSSGRRSPTRRGPRRGRCR